MAAPVRLGFIGVGFITQRAHLPAPAAAGRVGGGGAHRLLRRERGDGAGAGRRLRRQGGLHRSRAHAGARGPRRRLRQPAADPAHRPGAPRGRARSAPLRREAGEPRHGPGRGVRRRHRARRCRLPGRLQQPLRPVVRRRRRAPGLADPAPRPGATALQRPADPLVDQPLRGVRRFLRGEHHSHGRPRALLARRHRPGLRLLPLARAGGWDPSR